MIREFHLIFYTFLILFSVSLFSLAKNKDKEIPALKKISLEDEYKNFNSSLFNENSTVLLVNNGLDLDFESFIFLVKENHPDILSAELSKDIARLKRVESQGAFDPSINSKNSFNRFNSSSDIGQAQEAFTSNTSLDFLTGYGAEFALGARFAEGDIKTPISPAGDAGEYYVKAQIPLLRGAIYNSKFIKEKQSKLEEIIADYLLFRTKLKTLNEGSKAYWDWVAAKKIFDIESNLFYLVKDQVSFVQEQADLGNLAEISVVEAKREVQKRQVKVNKALRNFQETSLSLSKYTWDAEGRPYSILNADQVPEQLPVPKQLNIEDVETAKLNSLINRPEFKALALSRDITDLEKNLAKNQMLPIFDAFISSGFQAGDDSVNPSLIAGVDISIPLRLRTASSRKKQAEAKIQQLNLQERQLIQNIFLEIEDAASQVQTAFDRFVAAKQDYELSKELEIAENDRFELGDSTLFLVIRRQRATVEANIEFIKTLKDYMKASIRFKLVQGDLI